MLLILAGIMFVCIFFNEHAVSSTYFISLLICVVLLILDNHYGTILTNYKLTFFLFDLINMVAVCAIIYYEFSKHTIVLNVFLIILVFLSLFTMIVDAFFVKNKNITKVESSFIGIFKVGAMICILTYFFNVSALWFAIDAFLFELADVALKIYFNSYNYTNFNKIKKTQNENEESSLEDRIHSAGEDEGEID
jgi:hypothetical protein